MSYDLPISGTMHPTISSEMYACYESLFHSMKAEYYGSTLSCFFPMVSSSYYEPKQIKKEVIDSCIKNQEINTDESILEPAKRLMVVGRCPNGWAETDFSDYNSFVKEMKQTILNDGFAWLDNQGLAKDTYYDEDKDKECRYNINTSAFFRVSRKVLAQLKPETGIVKYNPRWFDHYVWTNLYCFSPKKGNANDKMIRIQLDGCRRLLLAQIKYYNPTHILFITDWDYWYEPFADLFVDVIKIGNSSKDNVIAKGVYENIKIVVGIRPDRTIPNKPNEEQYANDVIKAFEAI